MRIYIKIILGFLFFLSPDLVFPQSNTLQHRVTPKRQIIIAPPGKRTIEPGTFPTFVFTLYNNSNIREKPTFDLLRPRNWGIISQKTPSFIDPFKKEKVRITLTVPKSTRADHIYKIGLITKNKSYSDTSYAKVRIKAKPAIKLMSYMEEIWVIPGKADTINYVLQNDGNLKDIYFLKTKLPEGWKLIELKKKYTLKPQEKVSFKLLFKPPKSVTPGIENSIILTATSLVAMKLKMDVTDKHTIRSHIMNIEKQKVRKSLHPSIPINIGFTVNRIKKGEYPGIQLFANTGLVNFGNYSTQFDMTYRLNSVLLDQTQQTAIERLVFTFASQKWDVLLGDVMLESSPLMNRSSSAALTGYLPMGEIARGGRFTYKLGKAGVSFFNGKQIYSNHSITSANASYQPSEKISFSSTYLGNKESNLMTMEGLFNIHNDHSIGALVGLSKAKENGSILGRAAQLRAITKIKSMQLLGRVHWAEDSYFGQDKGQYGVVFGSRWIPKPYLYLWSNFHTYRKNLSLSLNDSTVFVNDLRTRLLFHHKNLPTLNIGLHIKRELYSAGYDVTSSSYDIQVRKQFKFGYPSIYFKKEQNSNSIYDDQQERYEFKIEWISYLRWLRFRVEQNFNSVNRSPLNSLSSFDINFNIRSILMGIFMSTGKTWSENTYDIYEARKLTRYGFRTNFKIKPFGKNYNFRLEVNNNNYGKDDWMIIASISTGSVSMFNLPVPFIKTKGKIYGEIFIDKNGNGIRDVDEPGVAQLLLFLKDENVLTDGDGKFEFPAMAPGEYPFSVDLVTLPAYLGLAKEVPKTISVRKGSNIYLQIPVTSMCSINGNVFLDENNNGKMNSEDKRLSVIRIIIKNEKGREWEAYSNKNGFYQLTDILPGVYSLTIDKEWLPKRIIPGKTESTVVLSQSEPRHTVNLAAWKMKLEIKTTFVSSKKRKLTPKPFKQEETKFAATISEPENDVINEQNKIRQKLNQDGIKAQTLSETISKNKVKESQSFEGHKNYKYAVRLAVVKSEVIAKQYSEVLLKKYKLKTYIYYLKELNGYQVFTEPESDKQKVLLWRDQLLQADIFNDLIVLQLKLKTPNAVKEKSKINKQTRILKKRKTKPAIRPKYIIRLNGFSDRDQAEQFAIYAAAQLQKLSTVVNYDNETGLYFVQLYKIFNSANANKVQKFLRKKKIFSSATILKINEQQRDYQYAVRLAVIKSKDLSKRYADFLLKNYKLKTYISFSKNLNAYQVYTEPKSDIEKAVLWRDQLSKSDLFKNPKVIKLLVTKQNRGRDMLSEKRKNRPIKSFDYADF